MLHCLLPSGWPTCRATGSARPDVPTAASTACCTGKRAVRLLPEGARCIDKVKQPDLSARTACWAAWRTGAQLCVGRRLSGHQDAPRSAFVSDQGHDDRAQGRRRHSSPFAAVLSSLAFAVVAPFPTSPAHHPARISNQYISQTYPKPHCTSRSHLYRPQLLPRHFEA